MPLINQLLLSKPKHTVESSIRVVNMNTMYRYVISTTKSSDLATLKKDVVDGRAAVPSMIQRRTRWIERARTPRMVTAGQTHTHCIRAAIPSQVYTRFMGRARRIFLCWQRLQRRRRSRLARILARSRTEFSWLADLHHSGFPVVASASQRADFLGFDSVENSKEDN